MLTSTARVVLTRRLPALHVAQLTNAGFIVDMWDSDEPMPRARLLDAVKGTASASSSSSSASATAAPPASGLVCLLSDKIDAELLALSPHLRVVSTMSVGCSHIDAKQCAERGIRIGYTPGVLTAATADLVLALTLGAMRRIPEAAAAVKSGAWSSWKPFWLTGKALAGARVGIIGMGRIGLAVAERFSGGFGCPISYTGGSGPKSDAADLPRAGATYLSLEELLKTSDVVVLLCALTSATTGLIGREQLKLMKEDATLINAARGEVVDQDALVEALKARPAFTAGLDVTTPEPLPTSHELLTLPNALILPHIGSATGVCRDEMARIAVANALLGVKGEPLEHEFK